MPSAPIFIHDPQWRAKNPRLLLRHCLDEPALLAELDRLPLCQPGDDLLLRQRAQRGLIQDWESAIPWWSTPSLLAWVQIPGVPPALVETALDRILDDPLSRNTLCLNATSLLGLPAVARQRAIEAFLLASPDPLPLFGASVWHVLANLIDADPGGATFYRAAQMLIQPTPDRWEMHALQLPRDMRWAILRMELAEQLR